MKSILFSLITVTGLIAQAQSSAELTCKAQAKEIAVQTYSNCMTEARNGQIDQIRKNYKEELSALKAKYDSELKRLSDSGGSTVSTKSKKAKTSVSVQEVQNTPAPRATKGIAKQLPTRSATREAAPVQSVTSSSVVSLPESSLEKEAAQADNEATLDMRATEDATAF